MFERFPIHSRPCLSPHGMAHERRERSAEVAELLAVVEPRLPERLPEGWHPPLSLDSCWWPPGVFSLDLGKVQDYTALTFVQRNYDPTHGQIKYRHALRFAHRWPLGTSYVAIVRHVGHYICEMGKHAPIRDAVLCIDATGVGKAIVDLFVAAKLPVRIVAITITGGQHVAGAPGAYRVPKRDLVAVMQALLQGGRLDIAPGLELAEALRRELQQFRVKVNPDTKTESFEAWREKDHDDLVLSVAQACWYGERAEQVAGVLVL